MNITDLDDKVRSSSLAISKIDYDAIFMFQIIIKARRNYLIEQYEAAGHPSDKIVADVTEATGKRTQCVILFSLSSNDVQRIFVARFLAWEMTRKTNETC